MKTMSALGSAVLLTAVSLFSQAVGFAYRVLLSRLVGAEVMGLYQLVMPVFSVLLSLTAVGFTVACSNLSAQYQALGDRPAAARTVRECLLGFLLSFALVAGVAAPFSDAISVHLLGDARSRLGLLLLLPCVLLTGVENIHKHYFYGVGQVRPPALTELCEPLIRAGAVLGLLWRFLPQSPERAVGLIVCGMILCEVFSAITLTLLYRRALGSVRPGGGGRKALRQKICRIALPNGLTALLGNLMGAWTAVLIPQRLVRAGTDVSTAMGAFGVLCGMTLPLLSLPTALLLAMGLVLRPKLAQAAALGRSDLARRRADKAITATAWLILPAAALLGALAGPLAHLLFREPAAGAYAVPLALAVALSCYESVLALCLNGLGRQNAAAAISLLSGAVQLLWTWWRMAQPGVGLQGYVEALLVSTVLAAVLHWRALAAAIDLKAQPFPWAVAPGLASLLAALCARLLFPTLTAAGLAQGPGCVLCLGFGGLVYLVAMVAMGLLPRP